ncbi:SDR family NAD(P)-dependent oxidoreductase [Sporosarcina sp. Te-1]|uniref:SDR family NAD(P)-dependent oxidoreductase n=1 Tax=Sporosarcina sp. Te-1 TaxID=2818390 RepID=UPI001A9EF5EE|nr:SDR family NAD(P)-dependent oxidoreductase [Sporosarcina sp. Te-1]QTD41365.1 SDR family NAD(P)-dependent oxidoreductase [Sporosarcina sp. Te-1]
MDIIIITGASKGIGLELAAQLKRQGKQVVGIARTNPEFDDDFIEMDLAETELLPTRMFEIIEKYFDQAASFTLINNAGIVDPIGIVGHIEAEMIERALAVNLTAPMIFANSFISRLADFKGTKKIVNISSGAGRNPYEGWGVYCTTKAGLDHFSRVVDLEQQSAEYPVQIASIAPGIIDTGMQETIRSSEASNFPLLDRFISYKEEGRLSSAEETARKLIAFLERDFKEAGGPILDLRHI